MSQIARTILNQIGARELACAGARDFVAGAREVQFRINVDKGGFMAARKGRFVFRVEYADDDTYRVRFCKVANRGLAVETIMEMDGVYCDMLPDIVRRAAEGKYHKD